MAAKSPEDIIIRAIHETFVKYLEGDGGLLPRARWRGRVAARFMPGLAGRL
jgi:hypothetical protein